MASVVLSGDTSGSVTIAAPAVAGSTTQTLVNVTGTLAPIVSGTVVTCAGQTSIDFTGIPSWVKRITVMFSGVSTSGTSLPLIQLGDSGGFEITGYISTSVQLAAGNNLDTSTAGFVIRSAGAANILSGSVIIETISENAWVSHHVLKQSTTAVITGGGDKTLSGTLDRVRITTVNGTDTFDTTPSAGSINILYE
jgi:hypothetical protein